MNNKSAVVLWFLAVMASFSAFDAAAETTVFVNVNVISMRSDDIVNGQSVVVSDGVITTIDNVDRVPVPDGARVIDGTDRYLMPGLAEMHAHVMGTAPATIDRLSTLFVANGITTIRGMLGRSSHIALRDELASGDVFGPRLVTSGPSLNGGSVSGPGDAARKVRQQQAAGYDFVKIHPGLSRDEFLAMAGTANELQIPYAGHVPSAAGVGMALQHGMATIDHLDGYFGELLPPSKRRSGGFFGVMLAADLEVDRIPEIAAETAAAGVWNVPTEVLIEQLIDSTPVAELRARPDNRYVSAGTVDRWVREKESLRSDPDFDAKTAERAIELRRQLILALDRAGAGLLLGSDAPQTFNVPGFSTHRELQALVASGLTPYEAIRTGTANVAAFLGSNGGYVETGRDADLILLDDNPLIDIDHSDRIHGVMLRGRWLSSSDLEKRLERYATQPGD